MLPSEPSSIPINSRKFLVPSDAARFLQKEKLNIILDTNILIQGCKEAHSLQREMIVAFCSRNKVHITETIHYEFLRNLSMKSFREKYRALWHIVGGYALNENENVVKKWFQTLSFIFFEILKGNPTKIFADYQENDRWISSCALGYGIDYILTTDHGDNGFYKEIFDDEIFDLSTEKHQLRVHLKKVNIERISRLWNTIQESGGIHLSI